MEILVFAKNRTTKDGKKFTTYVSKLAKKDIVSELLSYKKVACVGFCIV